MTEILCGDPEEEAINPNCHQQKGGGLRCGAIVEPALIIKGDYAKEDGALDSKEVEEEESTGGML